MRMRVVAASTLFLMLFSVPNSSAWILQSKSLPIAISDIGPYPDDNVKEEFSDRKRCVSGITGVFSYEYSEENPSGMACLLHIYFPDKTKGHWHLQVMVDQGKWIDAWNSNLFHCGDVGDARTASCKLGPTENYTLYKTDPTSTSKSEVGDKIDSIKIGQKQIWTENFDIPSRSSKGVCQVFSGNIDFRIRGTLTDGKSIFSPPFTVSYSGDNSWKKYSNGAEVCSGSDDLDGQGNMYPPGNPNYSQHVPMSKLQSTWDAFKVTKPINISQASVASVSKQSAKKPVTTTKSNTGKAKTCSTSDKNDYKSVYRAYILYNQQIGISNEIKQVIEDARQAKSKVLGRYVDYTAKDLYDLSKQDTDIAKYESKRDDLQPLLLTLALKCDLKMPSTTDLS